MAEGLEFLDEVEFEGSRLVQFKPMTSRTLEEMLKSDAEDDNQDSEEEDEDEQTPNPIPQIKAPKCVVGPFDSRSDRNDTDDDSGIDGSAYLGSEPPETPKGEEPPDLLGDKKREASDALFRKGDKGDTVGGSVRRSTSLRSESSSGGKETAKAKLSQVLSRSMSKDPTSPREDTSDCRSGSQTPQANASHTRANALAQSIHDLLDTSLSKLNEGRGLENQPVPGPSTFHRRGSFGAARASGWGRETSEELEENIRNEERRRQMERTESQDGERHRVSKTFAIGGPSSETPSTPSVVLVSGSTPLTRDGAVVFPSFRRRVGSFSSPGQRVMLGKPPSPSPPVRGPVTRGMVSVPIPVGGTLHIGQGITIQADSPRTTLRGPFTRQASDEMRSTNIRMTSPDTQGASPSRTPILHFGTMPRRSRGQERGASVRVMQGEGARSPRIGLQTDGQGNQVLVLNLNSRRDN